jgi:copper(I)-binding protein
MCAVVQYPAAAEAEGRRMEMTKMAARLLFAMAAVAPLAAIAHDHGAKGIEVVHAWAPAMSEADTKSTAVYMTMKNRSNAGDRLIAARARVASKVEIHEPGKESTSVAAVPIDAGKDLELSSAGHYLLLAGVSSRLQVHDTFKIALEFERAGRVVVDVIVEDAAPAQHRH